MSREVAAAFVAGALVGAGLAVSTMTDRSVVLGFLDIRGAWDPTLAFVLGGALTVTIPMFRSVLKRESPALGGAFRVPKGDAIDGRLAAGAAIFGIGWGLGGFCPGPALVGAAAGLVDAWIFVPAMIVGSFVAGRLAR
ncbi:MAG TPA: DUF6691 family protein [Steroidobacteraceae bacterium]|nr:DUF6691 family protein [Steroidobacteraceae bacterium]